MSMLRASIIIILGQLEEESIRASSLVAMPLIISTNGMTGTGFMKCIPTYSPEDLCPLGLIMSVQNTQAALSS